MGMVLYSLLAGRRPFEDQESLEIALSNGGRPEMDSSWHRGMVEVRLLWVHGEQSSVWFSVLSPAIPPSVHSSRSYFHQSEAFPEFILGSTRLFSKRLSTLHVSQTRVPVQVIEDMWREDPKKRPSARQVVARLKKIQANLGNPPGSFIASR